MIQKADHQQKIVYIIHIQEILNISWIKNDKYLHIIKLVNV